MEEINQKLDILVSLVNYMHKDLQSFKNEMHEENSSIRKEMHEQNEQLRKEMHEGFDRIEKKFDDKYDESQSCQECQFRQPSDWYSQTRIRFIHVRSPRSAWYFDW